MRARNTPYPIEFGQQMVELVELVEAGRKPTARQLAYSALLERIEQIYEQSDKTYGMPRIHAVLRSMGECVHKKRIARLMRLANIQGVSRRRSFIVTTRRGSAKRIAPDLVQRQFVANAVNELWVADMTIYPLGKALSICRLSLTFTAVKWWVGHLATA